VHKGYEYSRTGNPTRNVLENAEDLIKDLKAALA
jgi:cystathionine beta-lyase/cystathionine gamma-synthase